MSVASGERSFSKVKLIRNYLRFTMKLSELSDLEIISIQLGNILIFGEPGKKYSNVVTACYSDETLFPIGRLQCSAASLNPLAFWVLIRDRFGPTYL